MLGEGTASTNATKTGEEYNGGLFIACTDPDSNGWRGEVIRIVHTDYWAIARNESSINYYSLNTGIPFPYGRPVHLLARHDGSGHWRLWIDGVLAKDYNLDLDQATYGNRTNGGAGLDLAVHVNSVNISDARAQLGEMGLFRAAIWNTELSDADAAARVANAMTGSAYSGATPLAEYDYTASTKPTAVAEPNVTHGFAIHRADYLDDPTYEGGAGAVAASATTTFTNIIPSDAPSKTRLIGVLSWDAAAGSPVFIDSVTLGGVTATLVPDSAISIDTSQSDWSTRWYTVTSGGGNLVVVSSAQPTAVAAGVWDISDIASDVEFLQVSAVANGTGITTADGISSEVYAEVERGARVFAMFGRAGGGQSFTTRVAGDARYDAAIPIGSTSMATFASGRVGSSGAPRISMLHAAADTNGFMLGMLAARPAPPEFGSGEINAAGDLVVNFDKAVYAGPNAAIAVAGTGIDGSQLVSGVSAGNGTDTITFAMSPKIAPTVTDTNASYNPSVGPVFGLSEGVVAAFGNEAIDNNAVAGGGGGAARNRSRSRARATAVE